MGQISNEERISGACAALPAPASTDELIGIWPGSGGLNWWSWESGLSGALMECDAYGKGECGEGECGFRSIGIQ